MKKKVLPLVILVSIMSFGRGEIVRAAVNEENVTVSAEVSDRAEAVMTESDDATPDDDFTDADSDDAMPDDDFTDADPDDPTPDDDFEDTSETILDREFVKRNTTSYADRESGKYIGWKQKDGVWYYLEYGKPITGWFSENGNQYYLSPEDGAMAVGWTQIDGQWYYFNTDGAMQTGWLNLNGDWYICMRMEPEQKAPGSVLITWMKMVCGTNQNLAYLRWMLSRQRIRFWWFRHPVRLQRFLFM